jgi:hypothetical protein
VAAAEPHEAMKCRQLVAFCRGVWEARCEVEETHGVTLARQRYLRRVVVLRHR